MKAEFVEWYLPTQDRKVDAIRTCLLTFDTNVLLNLYYRDERTRNLFVDLVESFGDRAFVTHRVGLEYHRNRLKIAQGKIDAYQSARRAIRKAMDDVFQVLRDHPVFSQPEVRQALSGRFLAMEEYVEECRREYHPSDLDDPLIADGVLSAVERLFEGRVTPPLAIDGNFLAKARERFKLRVPPGYKDSKESGSGGKPEPDCFGDLILWLEALGETRRRTANGPRVPLVFVTDERKTDWWRTFPGDDKRLIAPHAELVREALESGATDFIMLSSQEFLELGGELAGWDEEYPDVELLAGELGGFEVEVAANEGLDVGGQVLDEASSVFPVEE